MPDQTKEPAQLAKVRRSRDYYLRGGDITFLVGLIQYHNVRSPLSLENIIGGESPL